MIKRFSDESGFVETGMNENRVLKICLGHSRGDRRRVDREHAALPFGLLLLCGLFGTRCSPFCTQRMSLFGNVNRIRSVSRGHKRGHRPFGPQVSPFFLVSCQLLQMHVRSGDLVDGGDQVGHQPVSVQNQMILWNFCWNWFFSFFSSFLCFLRDRLLHSIFYLANNWACFIIFPNMHFFF